MASLLKDEDQVLATYSRVKNTDYKLESKTSIGKVETAWNLQVKDNVIVHNNEIPFFKGNQLGFCPNTLDRKKLLLVEEIGLQYYGARISESFTRLSGITIEIASSMSG